MEKLQRLEISKGYVELLTEAERLGYAFKILGMTLGTKRFDMQQESFVKY